MYSPLTVLSASVVAPPSPPLLYRTHHNWYMSPQAKKFVESLPQVLKENISKEDAEKLKKTFTDLGATVVLE